MTIRSRLNQTSFANPADEAVVGILMVAAEVNREFAELCQGHGITLEQYNVLRILRGAKDAGLPRCEVAGRMITRAPDVTRMMDRLVKQGLVVRTWGTENRRHSIAKVTPEGLAVLAALDPHVAQLNAKVASQVGAEELPLLIGMLNRMLP
ncbi:MAG: MarR family transcriptional regulator [Gemmatimonadales bacterium]|nr:MarR family transcriptional regulator [Gemmatimonadales bacterium]